MNQKERMENGLWYDANYDEQLLQERLQAEELCFAFNTTRPSDQKTREQILKKLLPHCGAQVHILAPIQADYGCRTTIGEGTEINHGIYLMDGGGISIGAHCFIGPDCGFYTAAHPLLAAERSQGLEKASPIVVEDNVWLGGKVIILPGVTIGKGSVIGAGSVVSKDIPAGVVAAGSPCRVLRQITEQDAIDCSRE